MGWLVRTLSSSIGKKFIMALTGICLILFLSIHLVENITLYFGPQAFNIWVSALDSIKPVIRVVEVILALIIVYHIFNGIRLTLENRKANPKKYAINAANKNSTISSRTMFITGSFVGIFLVLHLSTFWYGFNFSVHETGGDTTYYSYVISWFQNEIYSISYIILMFVLGFHLNHGAQSAFQTFGWNHNKYFPLIQNLGRLYAIIMALGFASIPFYFLFINGGN